MKKIMTLAVMALFAMAMAACGNDDNITTGGGTGGSNTGGDTQTTRLSNSKFYLATDNSDGTTEHTVTFGDGNEVEYHVVWNWPEADNFPTTGDETYRGTYTYNEETQDNVWEANGYLKMQKVGDASIYYQARYEAMSGLLTVYNLLPNGDRRTLDRVSQ